jgi:hypothetical protein
MKLITDNFNISGRLYRDLGYDIAGVNNKYNINLIKLEKALEMNKNRILNAKNNDSAFNILKGICNRYKIFLHKRTQHRPDVNLKIWVDGEFEPPARVSLFITFNAEKAITAGTWGYLKRQIISKFMHEIVHFLRYSEDKTRWFTGDFHEYDIESYLSSIEEQYSYSHEVIFELMTSANRSLILSWYNKKIKNEVILKNFSEMINTIAKAPMFNNCIEVELV